MSSITFDRMRSSPAITIDAAELALFVFNRNLLGLKASDWYLTDSTRGAGKIPWFNHSEGADGEEFEPAFRMDHAVMLRDKAAASAHTADFDPLAQRRALCYTQCLTLQCGTAGALWAGPEHVARAAIFAILDEDAGMRRLAMDMPVISLTRTTAEGPTALKVTRRVGGAKA